MDPNPAEIALLRAGLLGTVRDASPLEVAAMSLVLTALALADALTIRIVFDALGIEAPAAELGSPEQIRAAFAAGWKGRDDARE